MVVEVVFVEVTRFEYFVVVWKVEVVKMEMKDADSSGIVDLLLTLVGQRNKLGDSGRTWMDRRR